MPQSRLLTITATLPKELIDRFWQGVHCCSHAPCLYCCWEWGKSKHNWGYGQTFYAKEHFRAHRLAYVIGHQRSIPFGLCVCHYCDNPPCCNPWHLWLGSQRDNRSDTTQKHRMPHGDAHWNAKVSTAQVEEIRALLARGIYQKIIAKQFGISSSMVSSIHRGESRVYS